MKKFVDEHPEENAISTRFEEMVTVAIKSEGTINSTVCRSICGSGKTFLPLITLMRDPCHSVSRRQRPEYYDIEVFIEKEVEQWTWDMLFLMSCRDYGNALRWTNPERLDHLHKGNNQNIFQYCLHSDGLIHDMRASKCHSGRNNVDPSMLDNVKKRMCGVSRFITLVLVSECILLSIQEELEEEKIRKKGDNQYFHCRESYEGFSRR